MVLLLRVLIYSYCIRSYSGMCKEIVENVEHVLKWVSFEKIRGLMRVNSIFLNVENVEPPPFLCPLSRIARRGFGKISRKF